MCAHVRTIGIASAIDGRLRNLGSASGECRQRNTIAHLPSTSLQTSFVFMLFSLWFAVLIILTGSFHDSHGWQLNGSIYLDSKPRLRSYSQLTISMSSHQPRSIPEVRDGDFVGVDAFGGASCFGRAVVDIVRSRGGHAYII